jgi:hypothetical protein
MYEFGVNMVATLEAGQNTRANAALEEHSGIRPRMQQPWRGRLTRACTGCCIHL